MRHPGLRRAVLVLGLALSWPAFAAGPALATYPPLETPPPVDHGQASIPFTGANVSAGFIILVGLLIVGGALLAAGRRRRMGAPR